MKPRTVPGICRKIDHAVVRLGNGIAWLNVLLVLLILFQVILRYAFGKGFVYLEELQWHLFGILIMFAYGYCLTTDAHIRLDVLHRNFKPKTKELVELLGTLFLLLPLLAVLLIHGIDFVESSLRVNERSDSPLGLPFRWAIKSVIPLSMVFLATAVFSKIVRSLALIFGKS